MIQIYIDADACPVKDETYKVAARYKIKTFVVANQYQNVPLDTLIEMKVAISYLFGFIKTCCLKLIRRES